MAALDGDELRANRRRFADFLEQDFGQGTYASRVRTMVESGRTRLIVNLNHLRAFDADFTRRMLRDPQDFIPAFEQALRDHIRANALVPSSYEGSGSDRQKQDEAQRLASYQIGFEGSFGANYVSPRTLCARFLRSLLCVEGIVTKCSLVHPKLVKSVHYCEATHKIVEKTYRDATSLDGLAPTGFSYPTKDPESGEPLVTEFGLCVYKDHQVLTIQEMPERAPAGQLPRSVDVIVEADLVDICKPGDRVQVIGVYRPLPGFKNQGWAKATFRSIVIANQVKLLSKELQGPVMTDEDIDNIKRISQRPDVFNLIASSLAPSIFGHDQIKRAVLLLLLGGNEKLLNNGHHIRGDINMLLVGDPSTAKSQLLRFVLSIAPLAISTNGRGSSGVGLTAAVTSDQETGERRLEAGAMVLADRGVVCIDEFDKMSEDDRVAIHEVMEQQTVTIAKAGIHATLNARCSVLAAANPVYGKYNRSKRPTENIALPDSLLSRFDMLFIVLDSLSAEQDRCIAEHVLRMHQYRPPNVEDERPVDPHEKHMVPISEKEEEEKTVVFLKFDAALHAQKAGIKTEILSIPFIKKYLLYAKYRVVPQLTEEVCSFVTDAYANLRSKHDDSKALPITPRTLETLFRLTIAHAKCCLRDVVLLEDAKLALELVLFALFQETAMFQKPVRIRGVRGSAKSNVQTDEKENKAHGKLEQDGELNKPPAPGGKRARGADEPSSQEPVVAGDVAPSEAPDSAPAKKPAPAKKLSVEDSRKLRAALNKMFDAAKGKAVKLADLVAELDKQKAGIPAASVRGAVSRLSKDGTLSFDPKTEDIRRL